MCVKEISAYLFALFLALPANAEEVHFMMGKHETMLSCEFFLQMFNFRINGFDGLTATLADKMVMMVMTVFMLIADYAVVEINSFGDA